MTLAEEMRSEAQAEVMNYPFSECLTEFLRLEKEGPDESSGYTDKRFYNVRQALLDRMDYLVHGD